MFSKKSGESEAATETATAEMRESIGPGVAVAVQRGAIGTIVIGEMIAIEGSEDTIAVAVATDIETTETTARGGADLQAVQSNYELSSAIGYCMKQSSSGPNCSACLRSPGLLFLVFWPCSFSLATQSSVVAAIGEVVAMFNIFHVVLFEPPTH